MPPEVMIHTTAVCETERIGSGSRIEAFAVVAATAVIGERCVIGQGVTIGPGVVLGDGVVVHAGARLVAALSVAPGVTIFENVVMGGTAPTRIGRGVTIGANVTVGPGVGIGQGAVVEPGTFVADLVPANAVVRGNPAQIAGYVADLPTPPAGAEPAASDGAERSRETRLAGVELHPVTHVTDLRGSLVAADFADLPFNPRRIFSVFGVPSEFIRGSHAHRECAQFLICLTGSIRCLVDNGAVRDEVSLSGAWGLHMPPMTWGTQYKFTRDALLLVLASDPYDAEDYIRDYDEFLHLAGVGT